MESYTVLAFLVVLSQKDYVSGIMIFKNFQSLNYSEMVRTLYRSGIYPKSGNVLRFPVPEDKVSWDLDYNEYNPPYYTSPKIIGKTFADEEDITLLNAHWNYKDTNINRCSFLGKYKLVNGYPLNPTGRTGLRGRGTLPRWGPNVEGSLVVTKWKRAKDGHREIHNVTKLPVVQVLLIRKVGFLKWNLPITFVNPGENVRRAMIRIFFSQYVMNYTNLLQLGYSRDFISKHSTKFFKTYTRINTGYSVRPQNTDNAWMESIVAHFHDEDGTGVSIFPEMTMPNKGNLFVRWIEVSRGKAVKWLNSCRDVLQKVAELIGAHW